ncbi:hypothetical protein SS1G_05430 [Sclerotinia sclerotiorum 1980 UF-70]|uniref:Uncharacterized protein n=1 Tax=Sclerotinia sclerotiorum (strain ATCC 18683 / 1980 / Ss-1) TaxID=665079 RepID=A7EJD7_SCLS1|nr:hypothetical protein SS1G_05430 [Sclerotinia sclerotiorum 1980 UF-70]EDO02953.1 hypothetical protein SS1G_05430 [Sclerotinia sclerotiorum 1980 UF-70]
MIDFFPSAAMKEEYRPESGHQYGPSPSMSSRGALPPTPPMQSDGGFDGRQSPSQASTSSYSVVSAPSYYFNPSQVSAINNMEPHAQRQPIPVVTRRVSMPVAPMQYTHSPFNGSYTMSPGAQSLSSYYSSPIQTQSPQVPGLYYQRPLPQQFPPTMMPVSVTLTPSSGANPWQHHHYISPSSAASFPQSQDRYIWALMAISSSEATRERIYYVKTKLRQRDRKVENWLWEKRKEWDEEYYEEMLAAPGTCHPHSHRRALK